MKKFLLFLTGCLSFLFLFLLYVGFYPIVKNEKGSIFYVQPGLSRKQFLIELSQQGIVTNPILFSWYMYFQTTPQLKTGEYLFPKGSSIASIWTQVTNGKGLYYHQFTIIPGWSFQQLRRELLKVDSLKHASSKLNDKQVMQYLGSKNLAPEGQFYPDTYNYIRNNSDLIILKSAYSLMQTKLKEAWTHRASQLPYKTSYQALIAASLIEKEAYLKNERPVIAGVLVNRLKKDMLLQFDPTVIYGLGDRFDGKIKKENLLEDNAYNTYLHKGLPPTPIAMPGKDSIDAALHPQKNEYYYFVAKGDGSHQFSKTLIEHHTAVDSANLHQNPYMNPGLIRNYMQSPGFQSQPTTKK